MSEKLVEFLKKHRVYREFIKRIEKEHEESLEQYCISTVKRTYISAAFKWTESLKGFAFWNKLDCKWRQYINL